MATYISVTFQTATGAVVIGRGTSLDAAAQEVFGKTTFVAPVPDFDRPGNSTLVAMRGRKQIATVIVD